MDAAALAAPSKFASRTTSITRRDRRFHARTGVGAVQARQLQDREISESGVRSPLQAIQLATVGGRLARRRVPPACGGASALVRNVAQQLGDGTVGLQLIGHGVEIARQNRSCRDPSRPALTRRPALPRSSSSPTPAHAPCLNAPDRGAQVGPAQLVSALTTSDTGCLLDISGRPGAPNSGARLNNTV